MEKHHKFSIWYVLLGMWVVLLIHNYIVAMDAVQVIPYSRFLDLLKNNRVAEVAITANQIQGTLKDEGLLEKGGKSFRTVRVDPETSTMLDQYNVTFKG